MIVSTRRFFVAITIVISALPCAFASESTVELKVDGNSLDISWQGESLGSVHRPSAGHQIHQAGAGIFLLELRYEPTPSNKDVVVRVVNTGEGRIGEPLYMHEYYSVKKTSLGIRVLGARMKMSYVDPAVPGSPIVFDWVSDTWRAGQIGSERAFAIEQFRRLHEYAGDMVERCDTNDGECMYFPQAISALEEAASLLRDL